jgi:hypothetical protein
VGPDEWLIELRNLPFFSNLPFFKFQGFQIFLLIFNIPILGECFRFAFIEVEE